MERLRANYVKDEVELVVVLMPGRSYVERPESLSAAYQEHVRSRILGLKPRLKVEIIDLASELRRLYQENSAPSSTLTSKTFIASLHPSSTPNL